MSAYSAGRSSPAASMDFSLLVRRVEQLEARAEDIDNLRHRLSIYQSQLACFQGEAERPRRGLRGVPFFSAPWASSGSIASMAPKVGQLVLGDLHRDRGDSKKVCGKKKSRANLAMLPQLPQPRSRPSNSLCSRSKLAGIEPRS